MTGVQTCALPISYSHRRTRTCSFSGSPEGKSHTRASAAQPMGDDLHPRRPKIRKPSRSLFCFPRACPLLGTLLQLLLYFFWVFLSNLFRTCLISLRSKSPSLRSDQTSLSYPYSAAFSPLWANPLLMLITTICSVSGSILLGVPSHGGITRPW